MVSDDTEHTCLVAQALIESAGDTALFARRLARGLRLWLLGLPTGVGWATLRATLKLSLGVSPARSGVPSAGNGPAMRSALLGVCYGGETERLRALVRTSTHLTHTDPRAETGALAVAVAGYVASETGDGAGLPQRFLCALEEALGAEAADFRALMQRAADSAARGETTEEYAASLGAAARVTGYVHQTVPVALHAWLRHPHDFRAAVLGVIACGGDTDTTAAITGAIVGASVGTEGIPPEWLAALWEWPRTVAWMRRLGVQLADVCAANSPQAALSLAWPAVALRNLVFTAVVLTHGFRRLLPPY